jgi:hypothetical protein
MERKETGSYYTKPELVDELIDSALKPVVEERVGAAESVEAKEEALLDIDVCDPACGSGAFLIAANNFLGKRLAEIRTESAYPDEQELRQARRSVVQHCIYGVDLNPMAVELAKVSLWINSAVENQPLSFLDHRIKQGNSLIGTTEELVSSGVPVDAYETSSGRDWHVGNDIRKRVRKENKNIPDSDKEVQAGLDWSSFSSEQEFVNLAEEIEALGEDSITAVERKAELYDEFEDSESLNRERLAFDVWTAAFYWPLDGSASEYPSPNTIEKVRRVVAEEFTDIDGNLGDMCARARELSETHSFFHWELEFPLVYDGGGFDCIIGNPPWETLEVKEKEFFRVKNPDISEANTQSQRKSLIEDLSDTDPELYSKFRNYEKKIENTSKFISKSGRFGLSAKGKINLYAPFTEHGLTNISSMGRCGILVPTGIATDYNTQDFFGEIISERKLVSLFDFVNKKHLFEGIPEDQRFCLLTLAGSNDKQSQFNFSFQNLSVDKSIIRESAYSLSKEQIMSVNPNTLNCPIFSSEQDKTITLEIYKDTPVLMNDMNETNTWNITYHTLFNAASDSDLFEENTLEELKSEGYELDSLNQFIKEDQTLLPVWEAKFIHQFDHRHGTFEGIPRDKRFARRAGTNEVSDSEKSNTEYEITPRYWMDAEYLNKRLSDIGWDEDWFFSFRDIVRVTSDIRVAKGTICPRYPLVHTAPILSFDCEEKPEQALVFTSLFTSLSFEFALRQSLAGAHITKYILKQLPMPEPSRIRNADIQIKGEKMNLWSTLVEYSAKLTWTSKSLNDFGKEIKCVDGPHKWDQEERIELRGIIDAAVAKLYRLDRDEFEYILDSYDALERSDQAEHGRFITKENTLEKFDQISLIE